MNPRIENPLLLLSAVRRKLEEEKANLFSHEPRIFFFVKNEEGQYFIDGNSAKLYYDSIPSDGYFTNTQKTLAEISPQVVGVVVRWHSHTKEFHTIEELSSWAFGSAEK